MFRGSVILLAFVLSAQALWSALVEQDISLDAALVRVLIAIPAAAIMLAVMRLATAGSAERPDAQRPDADRSKDGGALT